jgi:hypothetical protein
MKTARCRFSVGGLVAVLAVPIAALAGEAKPVPDPKGDTPTYVLAYQFKAGETVRWQVVHQATVQTTIQGTTQRAATRSESVKVWKVTEITPEGNAKLVYSLDRVKMMNKLANRAKMEYDSQEETAPPRVFEAVARTVGVPLTIFEITPRGKVVRREEQVSQSQNQPDMPITLLLPDGPVEVGHVWTVRYELSIPDAQDRPQQIKTRRRMELKSVTNGVATITVDYQILTPIEDPAIEARLAQRVSHATVKFDVTAGRIVSQQMDIDKRVLGFSGPTSSIHRLIRRTEQLIAPSAKVARKP